MDKELHVIFECIRSAIEDSYVIKQVDDEVDWGKVLHICKLHSVANIVCYGIEKSKLNINMDIMKQFITLRNLDIVKDINQEFEINTVLKKLDDNKVKCIVLKGKVLKQYYPTPDMRSMSDVDIIVDKDNIDFVHKLLLECGYNTDDKSEELKHECHYVYTKHPYMIVELHYNLLSETRYKLIDDYYNDLWNKLCIHDNYQYIFQMNRNEFYIYMIIHIMKHYLLAGTGIRSFIDVWIYLKRFDKVLDWDFINNVLNELGLLQFENSIKKIIDYWFGMGEDCELVRDMTSFIVLSGVYGNAKNGNTTEFLIKDGSVKRNMVFNVVNRIFPNIKWMKKMYPKLNNRLWLLPFYYIKRIINKVFFDKKHTKDIINDSFDYKYINYLKKHFKIVGLRIKE